MSFRDVIAQAAGIVGQKVSGGPVFTSNLTVPTYDQSGDFLAFEKIQRILGQSPAELWRSQPHLRTVVSFLARNVAQLGLPVYTRNGDNDRARNRTGVAGKLLSRPNPTMTRYELIYALVSDLALWDSAYWHVAPADSPSGWQILPLRTSWVTDTEGGTVWAPDRYVITPPSGRQVKIPAAQVLAFHGWDPMQAASGYSPARTLKEIIAETNSAQIYRNQRWRKGGRIGSVITRPAGHSWSEGAEKRFMESWKSRFAGDNGSDAGGTPILADGMTLQQVGFSAKDDEYVNGTKLALSTVAGVYHVNPTMIGQLDNANYSNVREFRRGLFGDTLGPTLAQLEDRFNAFLLPMIGAADDDYAEFNIGEKLQGSFEEQAKVLQTAIGAPYMTRNEGRGLQNLPAIDGADELIVPLNVIEGGQASPTDSAPKRRPAALRKAGAPRHVKARASASDQAKAAQVFERFFKRQGDAVLSALGAKADGDWWDSVRWDSELAAELLKLGIDVTKGVAVTLLDSLGIDPAAYNADQTEAFLEAVAQSRAAMVNETTKAAIDEAIVSDDPELTPAAVFKAAVAARAAKSALTYVTTMSGFATTEAVKQTGNEGATKTWRTTSKSPRASHRRMSGETVSVHENFSNGAAWPGDPVLGADGTAGCECDVEVNLP